MSGIAQKQNAFKFKFAPQKQASIVRNSFGRKMGPSLPTGLKHNDKSGTALEETEGGNHVWTIPRHRKHWEQDTERRHTTQEHTKLKRRTILSPDM